MIRRGQKGISAQQNSSNVFFKLTHTWHTKVLTQYCFYTNLKTLSLHVCVCVCFSLSLSLSHTHTHTHTHKHAHKHTCAHKHTHATHTHTHTHTHKHTRTQTHSSLIFHIVNEFATISLHFSVKETASTSHLLNFYSDSPDSWCHHCCHTSDAVFPFHFKAGHPLSHSLLHNSEKVKKKSLKK